MHTHVQMMVLEPDSTIPSQCVRVNVNYILGKRGDDRATMGAPPCTPWLMFTTGNVSCQKL